MSKILIPTLEELDKYGLNQTEPEPHDRDPEFLPPISSAQTKSWLFSKGFPVVDSAGSAIDEEGFGPATHSAALLYLKSINLGEERIEGGSLMPIKLKSRDWVRAAVVQQMQFERFPRLLKEENDAI
jgi:hypothetical protein